MSRSWLNTVEHDADSYDEANVYAVEFVWPSKAKPYMCDDLKPICLEHACPSFIYVSTFFYAASVAVLY